MKYKSNEEAYVDDVKLLGNDSGTETLQQISIKFRIPVSYMFLVINLVKSFYYESIQKSSMG